MPDPTAFPRAPLLLPPDGDRAVLGLRRRARLRAARWLLTAPPTEARLDRRLQPLREWLLRALKARPAAALQAVGAPDVLGPLLTLSEGLADPRALLPQIGPDLAVALVRAGLTPPAPLLWDLPVAKLRDPGSGKVFRFDPPARGILADRGAVRIRLADGRDAPLAELPGEPCYHPITRRLHLALDDSNPLSMLEEHPDKDGNAIALGDRSVGEWRAALVQALDWIAASLPGWRAGLPGMVTRAIPVGYDPERHLSASYREIPGVIYLTLHPDPLTMAEAIVHEAQHNALNLLSLNDPVLENGQTTWTASPVRPDLRPLMGVLLAAHAFVPVAAMHAELARLGHPATRTLRFHERRAEVLASNARAVGVLAEKAEPSPRGAALLSALYALHAATLERAGGEISG